MLTCNSQYTEYLQALSVESAMSELASLSVEPLGVLRVGVFLPDERASLSLAFSSSCKSVK